MIISIINAVKIMFPFLTSCDLELFTGSDITGTNVLPVDLNEWREQQDIKLVFYTL